MSESLDQRASCVHSHPTCASCLAGIRLDQGEFSWEDYVAWTDWTAMRRSNPSVAGPDLDLFDRLVIWGFGLGGEMLELLAEIEDPGDPFDRHFPMNWDAPITEHERFRQRRAAREKVVEEAGDCVWYVARIYKDTGNVRERDLRKILAVDLVGPEGTPPLRTMCRHVGRLVETMKKAFRRNGRRGLEALARPDVSRDPLEGSCGCGLPGRREEIGGLLDLALASIEGWLEANGSNLAEVCEANRRKLEKRRAEGTIGKEGTRA